MKTVYFAKSLVKNFLLCFFAGWLLYFIYQPWLYLLSYPALNDINIAQSEVYAIAPHTDSVSPREYSYTEMLPEDAEIAKKWMKELRPVANIDSLTITVSTKMLYVRSKWFSFYLTDTSESLMYIDAQDMWFMRNIYPDGVWVLLKDESELSKTVRANCQKYQTEIE